MMPPVLELRDVSFAYAPGQWALHHISLSIRAADCVALLGANGAGKSTLLLMLNGAEQPCSGALLLDGVPVRRTREDVLRLRQSVGILLQDPDDQILAPTVEHDVALGPLNAGASQSEARELVEYSLRALDIPHLAARPVHELSLGEKKRVALAGLTAMQPRVLLLDEPTAGLDFRGVRALLQILERMRASGTSIVQATHDMNLALEWADHAHILCRGSVIASGNPGEVLSDEDALESAGLEMPVLLRARRAG